MTETCSCGICKYDENENVDRCSICLKFRCKGDNPKMRSVCYQCISAHRENLYKIFIDGKNSKGEWIDPALKKPITTCKCGLPWNKMCGLMMVSALSQKKTSQHSVIF